METTPETLAQLQHDTLKEFVLNKLKAVIEEYLRKSIEEEE